MKINVSRESQLAREIGSYEQVLNTIKNKLDSYNTKLASGWKATEMAYITNAINDIKGDLSKVASKLSSIESEIISTAQMIRREEEAKEAAERAAALERARELREEREEAMKRMQENNILNKNMNR